MYFKINQRMEWHWHFSFALILPSPGLIAPLPVNALLYILADNVLNRFSRNPSFCFFFASFLIVSLIAFVNNPDSFLNYFLYIFHFFIWNYYCFSSWSINLFWVAVSAADIPSDNPNGIKTLLARDVRTFFINGNQLPLIVKNI